MFVSNLQSTSAEDQSGCVVPLQRQQPFNFSQWCINQGCHAAIPAQQVICEHCGTHQSTGQTFEANYSHPYHWSVRRYRLEVERLSALSDDPVSAVGALTAAYLGADYWGLSAWQTPISSCPQDQQGESHA